MACKFLPQIDIKLVSYLVFCGSPSLGISLLVCKIKIYYYNRDKQQNK